MACPIILTSYIMIYSYYKSPPRDSCHFQSLSASPFVLFTYYDNSEGLGIQNRIFIYVYNIVRRKLNMVFSLYLPFLAFWPIWWCYKWEWIQTMAKNYIRITRSVTNPNVQKKGELGRRCCSLAHLLMQRSPFPVFSGWQLQKNK